MSYDFRAIVEQPKYVENDKNYKIIKTMLKKLQKYVKYAKNMLKMYKKVKFRRKKPRNAPRNF